MSTLKLIVPIADTERDVFFDLYYEISAKDRAEFCKKALAEIFPKVKMTIVVDEGDVETRPLMNDGEHTGDFYSQYNIRAYVGDNQLLFAFLRETLDEDNEQPCVS